MQIPLRHEVERRYTVTPAAWNHLNERKMRYHIALYDELFFPVFGPHNATFLIHLTNPSRAEWHTEVLIECDMTSQAAFNALYEDARVRDRMRAIESRFVPAYDGDVPLIARPTRCHDCLFGANHLPEAKRITTVLREAMEVHNSCFVCHHHNDTDIVCRGFYDAHPEIHGRTTLVIER